MSKYVQIARRENNNKRGFLIVNPYLGKHVPIEPKKVIQTFDAVAELTPKNFKPQETLVVGFAETATALALHYAITNKTYFIQTTRENVQNIKNKLYFTEEHSHATEQYIIVDQINNIINKIKHIIFIDDEISTGNTVLHAIDAFNKYYNKAFEYTVISILNGMNTDQKETYKNKNIGIYALEYIDKSNFEDIAKTFKPNGNYYKSYSKKIPSASTYPTVHFLSDTRSLIEGTVYNRQLTTLNAELDKLFVFHDKNAKILILGTEEFMYAGLSFGKQLQDKYNFDVKFQATTRSPIDVCTDNNYPLHDRHELISCYDDNRTTYLYDIKNYDYVIIMTEAKYLHEKGLNSLLKALNDNNFNRVIVMMI